MFWHEKFIYFISDCIQILWARQISITVTTYLKIILSNSKNVNSRYSNKRVYIYNSFNSPKPIPRSHPTWNFSHMSVGVRVGEYFWIIGGNENCLTYNLGIQTLIKYSNSLTNSISKSGLIQGYGTVIFCGVLTSQRKSLLWSIKKRKWINGPRLPNDVFLLHSSSSAINSTHVIFVGANAYFSGRGT